MIYIARRDYDKALEDCQGGDPDEGNSEQYFHLAWVLNQLDRKSEAGEALKTAESKGLNAKDLSPYEKPYYERLKESL